MLVLLGRVDLRMSNASVAINVVRWRDIDSSATLYFLELGGCRAGRSCRTTSLTHLVMFIIYNINTDTNVLIEETIDRRDY